MHRNSFIISSFLAVFSFFFLAASSSAAKITESVSINTLNTTTDAASLSEQTVFSTHPPTVNAKKPHIGAITPNLPESVTGHVLYLIHHDRVIDRICHYDASGFTVTPKSTKLGKWEVGEHDVLRKNADTGLTSHHVGQDKAMRQFVPDYEQGTAPAMLVPRKGHIQRIDPDIPVLARKTSGFSSARDVVARDITELRRVYPDAPNSKLQELIQLNKTKYPAAMRKR